MSLATICLHIGRELKEVEDSLFKHTSSEVELVSTAAQYVLQNGGKRIRPALLLLSAKMLGLSGPRVVSLGCAIEMIHAASLMHDDVLDNASLRRGKTSANVKWGNQVSILVGDFLWCKASELAIADGNNRLLQSITEAVKKTTEGEILEITRSNNFNITEEDYLTVIKLKTAMLFSCSCQIGSILAEGTEQFENALKNFGLNLGIAFQLSDDVLDYTSNEETIGKKAGTDLCEGKLTLPIILTLKKCNSDEAGLIKEVLLANNLDIVRFNVVKNILKRYGALEDSLDTARNFAKKAKEDLSPFKPSIEKDSLMALADYAVSRNE